jgi:hypothetical protein
VSTHEGGRVPLALGSRRPWAGLVAGLFVLGTLELLVGHLIIDRLLEPPWSTALDLLLLALTVAMTGLLASPLWATASLTEEELDFDLRALGRAHVPLVAISAVEPHHPGPVDPVPPGVVVASDPARATISRGGGSGCLRLRLSRPITIRHSLWRRGATDDVVVRLGDPPAAQAAILAAAGPRPGPRTPRTA